MRANVQSLRVVELQACGSNKEAASIFRLRLGLPADATAQTIWTEWQPGQFVMLRPENWDAAMPWPRALSIGLCDQELILYFQIAGRGTKRLGQINPGERVQVVGPLGNAFKLEPQAPTLLLAGGIGLIPFMGYTAAHPCPKNLKMLFGHRAPLDAYPFAHFSTGIEAYSHWEQCPEDLQEFLITLEREIKRQADCNGLTLACGPSPFLKTVQSMSLRHGSRTQLSLETRMACGVGACLGCVVRPRLAESNNATNVADKSHEDMAGPLQKGQPVPTCTCGPVFWADSIELD